MSIYTDDIDDIVGQIDDSIRRDGSPTAALRAVRRTLCDLRRHAKCAECHRDAWRCGCDEPTVTTLQDAQEGRR